MAVHRFAMDGVKLAVDGNSGAVHILDDLAYEVLGYVLESGTWGAVDIAGYDEAEVAEALAELDALRQQGLLFSPPIERQALPSPEGPYYVKALCLNVSHDCNLRCTYCFAGKGAFGGERLQMPPEVGREAVDFLLRASGPYHKVEIDFFGGEPLLNLPVVKDVIKYGRARAEQANKEISFTITTNGLGLTDDIIDYLNDNMYNVVLSLDGRKEVTDRMRRFPGNDSKSTYDAVAPKMQKMAQARGDKLYYVRGTFTAHNLDFCEDVRHLVNAGFHSVSVEPVVAGEEEDYALRSEHLPRLFAEYEGLARYYVKHKLAGNDFDFFHFNVELDNPPCLDKRISGCGAGHEYVAVDPYGDIYPCHQFVDRKEFRLGTVFNPVYPTQSGTEVARTFKFAHAENKKECQDCWAKLYCGGGCHASAFQRNGDLLHPDSIACSLQKKRLECALYAKAVLLGKE